MVVAAGLTVKPVPLVTAPTPWSMLAEEAFTKPGVNTVLLPAVMVVLLAEKEVMATAEPAVTVTEAVALSPAAFVTVRPKVVLTARLPVETALPLVTEPMPWSMLPVPPSKVAVSWLLPPLTTAAGLARKEAMEGEGTTITVTVPVTGPPMPATVSV